VNPYNCFLRNCAKIRASEACFVRFATWRTRRNIRSVSDSVHSLNYMKAWHHPQNRKYTSQYRQRITAEDNMWKKFGDICTCGVELCERTDKQTNKQTDTQTRRSQYFSLKIIKSGSRDADHVNCGLVYHTIAIIWHSLPVHQIWLCRSRLKVKAELNLKL